MEVMEINADSSEPRIFKWFINLLFSKSAPYIVIAFWICTIMVGIFYGSELLNITEMDFTAPDGTEGEIARGKMMQEFETRETSASLLLYFRCPTCGTQNSSIHLISSTNKINEISKPIMWTMSAEIQQWLQFKSPLIAYSDYYTTSMLYNNTNELLITLANSLFLSKSLSTALAIITFDNSIPEREIRTFFEDTEDKCAEIAHDYGGDTIQVSITGGFALSESMAGQIKTDVGINCLLLVPVALCVLAAVVRSWRLMIIPVACFIISICAAFSLFRPIAEHVMDISPMCPALMMAVTVAMSIDYSLFLLSRFEEQIERTREQYLSDADSMVLITREAVRQSMRHSGKVVALSGCILTLTFLGLVFYPLNMLQSVSLGSALSIICTIVVNLTCTPSIILLFPNFFTRFGWAGCPCEKIEICNRFRRKKYGFHEIETVDSKEDQPLSINEVAAVERNENEAGIATGPDKNGCEQCWFSCVSKITVCPWSIVVIIVVYAAIAPFGYQFLSFKEQLDDRLLFPRDSEYLHTYNDISNDFTAGFMAPWNILIFAKDGQKVYANPIESGANMTYLTETGLIIEEVINECYQNGYYLTINGIGYTVNERSTNRNTAPGQALNQQTQTLLYSLPALNDRKQVYQYLTNGKISVNRTSSYYSMTTEFDPFYENALNFVDDFRDYLYDACDKYGYECHLSGGSVGEVDMVREIYAHFGPIMIVIVAIVFCLMGFAFKSVFIPFRLFATIAIPLTFVYGLSVMVYQNGFLSFLDSPAVANTDGIFWLMPIMTLPMLIGLALDYDIFLFARIYEYKTMDKMSTNEAIVRGVYKTGSIITAAGVIMAISFVGLIFSQITALCQTGFILVFGVLVDTFIIRTALVPAIVSIAKEVNWWPGLRGRNRFESSLTDVD